jgi:hypothetical protein
MGAPLTCFPQVSIKLCRMRHACTCISFRFPPNGISCRMIPCEAKSRCGHAGAMHVEMQEQCDYTLGQAQLEASTVKNSRALGNRSPYTPMASLGCDVCITAIDCWRVRLRQPLFTKHSILLLVLQSTASEQHLHTVAANVPCCLVIFTRADRAKEVGRLQIDR